MSKKMPLFSEIEPKLTPKVNDIGMILTPLDKMKDIWPDEIGAESVAK